jgi:signal transduction histidine kinase
MVSDDRLLGAVQLATRKLASGSAGFDDLLKEVLGICVEAVGSYGGTIYLHDPVRRTLVFQHVLPSELRDTLAMRDIPDDYGVAGRVFQTREAVMSEFAEGGDPSRREIDAKVGVTARNMLTVPLMVEGEQPIGVVQLVNKIQGPFTKSDIAVLDTVSAVSTLAYLNYRLMAEQARASQLLGMGKVGHDIKNMAASGKAIIYFLEQECEILAQSGPPIAESVAELQSLVKELASNNERILSYATLISDLSAGKPLEPSLRVEPLAKTIEIAASYMESEARRKGVCLKVEVDDDAPASAHDPMYLNRIVQNLVGNAIKAVSENTAERAHGSEETTDAETQEPTGEVEVRYRFAGDTHVIEVRDSGLGMSAETIRRILSGRAQSTWGDNSGSGWGTKIVIELTQAQGGSVEIESELGVGSVFRILLPHRPADGA